MSDKRAALIRDERIFTGWDWVVFCALSVLNLTAVAWMTAYWLGLNWRDHVIFLVLVTLMFLRGILLFEARWFALPLVRRAADDRLVLSPDRPHDDRAGGLWDQSVRR